jgi:hypothetical protein
MFPIPPPDRLIPRFLTSPKLTSKENAMNNEQFQKSAQDYLQSIQRRLQSAPYQDFDGSSIKAFSTTELQAIQSFLDQIAAQSAQGSPSPSNKAKQKNFNIAIELEADARKHVVVILGILPFLREIAPKIAYLTCDGNAEARAKLGFASTLGLGSPPLTFGTWDAVVGSFANNYSALDLSGFWVIGDMDWSKEPIGDKIGEERINGFKGIVVGKLSKVIIHQKGKKSIVPYPPKFDAKCFIATAVCDSPTSWEVHILRKFRDEILIQNKLGHYAIEIYQHLSPPLAGWIEGKPQLQKFLRRFLIKPLAQVAGKLVAKSRR